MKQLLTAALLMLATPAWSQECNEVVKHGCWMPVSPNHEPNDPFNDNGENSRAPNIADLQQQLNRIEKRLNQIESEVQTLSLEQKRNPSGLMISDNGQVIGQI